jgi:hypothetical protein
VRFFVLLPINTAKFGVLITRDGRARKVASTDWDFCQSADDYSIRDYTPAMRILASHSVKRAQVFKIMLY